MDRQKKIENFGDEFFYFNLDDHILEDFRLSCLKVTKNDVIEVCERYLFDSIVDDFSSKIIFGSNDNNLEALVARGWAIHQFSNILSYKKNKGDF